MNELYELKDGMYWNVEPDEVITQYIWYLKDKNKRQKEILDKIKEYCERERVNILTNFEYLETTDLDNILKLLEEIE